MQTLFLIRSKHGEVRGPFAADEIYRLAASGQIEEVTEIQRVGGSGLWRQARSFKGLTFGPPAASHEGATRGPPKPAAMDDSSGGARQVLSRVSEAVSQVAGTERVRKEHVSGLFSQVFRRHTADEAEAVFAVGLAQTTPSLRQIQATTPTPWVYSRILLFFLICAFVALRSSDQTFTLMAGLLGPVAMAAFVFECNISRNISLFLMLKLFFAGGVLSLAFVGPMYKFFDGAWPGWASFREEPAKLFALVLLARGSRYPWILNGLCLGAAVGAGFSFFETLGDERYAAAAMIRSISLPLGDHTLWTAIVGAGLWRVKGGRDFEISMLGDRRFLGPALTAVVLHALWNTQAVHEFYPIFLGFSGGSVALGAICWIVFVGLILSGIKEIREAQAAAG